MNDEFAQAPSNGGWARIDLHCHSRYSASSEQWMARQFGLRECYTDPRSVYRQAKARGMTHVTLTDHDTITGALRLADEPDFVIGEEVTAFFPSEALSAHVLVWGIDERQHHEIQQLRFNVIELAAYLREQGIAHGLAHPLSFIGGELRPDHFELLLLLFGLWESHNGSCSEDENLLAAEVLAASPRLLPHLAERHGVDAAAPLVRGFAGSDDHSGLDAGSSYTEIVLGEGEDDPLAVLMRGGGRVAGTHNSTARLAHMGISLLLKGPDSERRGWLARLVMRRAMRSDLAWEFLERPRGRWLAGRALSLAATPPWKRIGGTPSLKRVAVAETAHTLIHGDLIDAGLQHERLADLVDTIWQRTMRENLSYLKRLGLGEAVHHGEPFKLLLQSQALVAPYLVAASYHARQRAHARAAARALADHGIVRDRPGVGPSRVAMFTDTYDEISGVTSVLRPLVRFAVDEGWPFTMVSCDDERRSEPGREVFAGLETFSLDIYDEFPLVAPPILQMLKWCEEADVRLIHAATPGPVGMVSALLARSLGVPFVATYHTDVPRLGFFLTGDRLLEETLWSYVRWFYGQCDVVFCPSRSVQDDLLEHNVRARFEPLEQAIDPELFSPARRREELHRSLGGGKRVLLWVGRISPEKGLDFLAAALRELHARRDDARLVVVGDGPYREEFEPLAPGASFLGYRTGEELASIFASADVFVFPGRAETFGQVLLEAAASGLPSVATAGVGVDESTVRDETALVVAPGDLRGFVASIERLLDDGALHERLSHEARRWAAGRNWPASFRRLHNVYLSLGR